MPAASAPFTANEPAGSFSAEIPSCCSQPSWIVAHQTKRGIARCAKQASNLLRVVTMIHRQRESTRSSATNRTGSLLLLQDRFVLLNGDPIRLLQVRRFLGALVPLRMTLSPTPVRVSHELGLAGLAVRVPSRWTAPINRKLGDRFLLTARDTGHRVQLNPKG